MQDAMNSAERIQVSVRMRPLNEKEMARNDLSDWECINCNTIVIKNSQAERSILPSAYTFDRVFNSGCSTKQVYEEAAKTVALSALSGINSSIFAYGQTSSGKTFTMSGITEYALADIYDYIGQHEDRVFRMKFSAIEIYNEAVRDLLSSESTPLRLLDDPEKGTVVERLTEETLRGTNHLKELLSICEAQRQIGETCLNEASSRSHQILRLTIESFDRELLGRESSSSLNASLDFVDLAGSERASQSLTQAERLKEGCHINRSLLTLGTVIRKLSKGRNGHIPFRDSKLTRILQSSLGGNARTSIICTMSPARSHIEQSRNTLQFATYAKEVATSAKVNIIMSDKALVKHLQRELAKLEDELRVQGPTSARFQYEALLKEKEIHIQKMEKEMEEVVRQRDLAQSNLEKLLRAFADDQASIFLKELSHPHRAYPLDICKDEISTFDIPGTPNRILYHAFSNSHMDEQSKDHSGTICDEHLEISEIRGNQSFPGSISLSHTIASVAANKHRVKNNLYEMNDDFDNICKEVRCIEIQESSEDRSEASASSFEGNDSLLPSTLNVNVYESDHKMTYITNEDKGLELDFSTILMEQKVGDVQKSVDHSRSSVESSSCIISEDLLSSEKLCLYNRSSKGTLMTESSPRLQAAEEIKDYERSTIDDEDIHERSGDVHSGSCGLNEGSESGVIYVGHSQISQHTASIEKTDTNMNNTSINTSVPGQKEMPELWSEENFIDYQVQKTKISEDIETEKNDDAAFDPMKSPSQLPSQWPLEFEKQQRQLIELWNGCNVSLVHRTYFFILMKGEPADAIYMEVELRRLSFLKNMFSPEKLGEPSWADGNFMTYVSSTKALARERELLSKQMQKIFTKKERETLFQKWGIGLETKRRKLQLARRIWSRTTDMEHVRESARIVAKLIGFIDQGQALKEMFSLRFTPHLAKRRSFGWKNSNTNLGAAFL